MADKVIACFGFREVSGDTSSTNVAATTWHVARSQLQIRLRLASQKTLTIVQQAMVASAVFLAKLLYIARHAWPTTEMVNLMDKSLPPWNADSANDPNVINCMTKLTTTNT